MSKWVTTVPREGGGRCVLLLGPDPDTGEPDPDSFVVVYRSETDEDAEMIAAAIGENVDAIVAEALLKRSGEAGS